MTMTGRSIASLLKPGAAGCPVGNHRQLDMDEPITVPEMGRRVAVAVRWGARLVGAGLLGATAGIHLYLWHSGYRSIHIIGTLFLLNGVGGSVLCLAVGTAPRRFLGWFSAAGVGLQAGTLGGLLLSLQGGLFGFTETTQAPYVTESIAVEIAGAVVLGALTAAELRRYVVARRSRRAGRATVRTV